jgi:hypothetical protein
MFGDGSNAVSERPGERNNSFETVPIPAPTSATEFPRYGSNLDRIQRW